LQTSPRILVKGRAPRRRLAVGQAPAAAFANEITPVFRSVGSVRGIGATRGSSWSVIDVSASSLASEPSSFWRSALDVLFRGRAAGRSAALALALESAANNTGFVLAIELVGDDVLLFAVDAQVENWESWQDVKWGIDGTAVTRPDLLALTMFYKVGHHGSHNATLKHHGFEQRKRRLSTAVPVNHDVPLQRRWGQMLSMALVHTLDQQAGGRMLLSNLDLQPMEGLASTPLCFEIGI
jgi:hypothetical protein